MLLPNVPPRIPNALHRVVTVNTAVCTLLDAAPAGEMNHRVLLQNLGTVAAYVNIGGNASNTGANGEFVLKAGTGANDGLGGVLGSLGELDGCAAKITASVGSGSTTVGVTRYGHGVAPSYTGSITKNSNATIA